MKKITIAAMIAGLALVASPASATAILGVKTIVVTNAQNTWLQVAEVDAFNGSYVNVSKTAYATASASDSGGYELGHGPEYAIDGNYNPDYYAAASLFHSATDAAGTSLTITLDNVQDLTSFGITGRSDGGYNYRDLYNVSLLGSTGTILDTFQINATGTNNFGSITFGAVPEPATWAMMLLGFGMIGVAARSRRRQKVQVTYA